MNQSERIRQIQFLLKEKGTLSIRELCEHLKISEATARRDIIRLAENDPSITRFHGGMAWENTSGNLEYKFERKLHVNRELKKRIASATLEYIKDDESLLLDSGTTCLYIAEQLYKKKSLRVVSLDIKIAEELAKYEKIESMIVGGTVRTGFYTIGESFAEEMLTQIHVDKAIMSADAVDIESGITNYSIFEVGVKRNIFKVSDYLILVADHTKFGNVSLYKISDLKRFNLIVTTKELGQSYIDAIRKLNISLVLA
jgi:DeoR/GlpR family transcriptional regulator of sugar metabolism